MRGEPWDVIVRVLVATGLGSFAAWLGWSARKKLRDEQFLEGIERAAELSRRAS